MNALVIYDSNYGNTKLVAEEIVIHLEGNAKTVSVKNFHPEDLTGVDLVIWGSPVNSWRPTSMTTSVLNQLSESAFKGIKFTTFDTRIKSFLHGDAKDQIATKIRQLGGDRILEPKAFYVNGRGGPLADGEIERAGDWATLITCRI